MKSKVKLLRDVTLPSGKRFASGTVLNAVHGATPNCWRVFIPPLDGSVFVELAECVEIVDCWEGECRSSELEG